MQDLWKRWKNAYLHTLQQRNKWLEASVNVDIDIGKMVIIKDNNCPPLEWRIGRIAKLYPGPDGHFRVADVKLPDGQCLKRPLVKLCVLPTQ